MNKKGFVYIFKIDSEEFEDNYKIGYAKSLKSRMSSHQTSHPKKLILVWTCKCYGYIQLEDWAKNKYKSYKIKGEWFKFDNDKLKEVIENIKIKGEYYDDMYSTYKNSSNNIFNGEYFECNKCDKKIIKYNMFEKHLEEHKIDEDYIKNKNLELEYYKNLGVYDGKNLYCEKCNKKFYRLLGYKSHIGISHNDYYPYKKYRGKYLCEFLKEDINDFLYDDYNKSNKIIINPFSNEYVGYIKHDCMKDICEYPLRGIPKLVKLINFNSRHPENHNIILLNKSKKNYKVFDGDQWYYRTEKWIIHNLINSHIIRISNFLDNNFDDNEYKYNITKILDEAKNAVYHKNSFTKELIHYIKNQMMEGLDNISKCNKIKQIEYIDKCPDKKVDLAEDLI